MLEEGCIKMQNESRWETIKSLGEGGQAHTFLVKDKKGSGDQSYVLKRLKNIKRIGRFKQEIEAIRTLSHENIVQLIDFDLDADKPYLVMEYCTGGSLAQAEPFWLTSPVKALTVFLQVCEGVVHAHSKKIIHRDLKPENIFLRERTGPAVVGDFGICHIEDDGSRFTLTEEAVGPRLYIAPELEDGKVDKVSSKSDVYSLGKLLYWLISGQVFSREKYRDIKWDLKGKNEDTILGWNNIYLEHVNNLLDLMITNEPEERRELGNIMILAKRARILIEKEFSPVKPQIRQPCTYCGQGYYVSRVVSDAMAVRNFGLNAVGSSDWRIFTCNMCGHVQFFRVDYAQQKEWWGDIN